MKSKIYIQFSTTIIIINLNIPPLSMITDQIDRDFYSPISEKSMT